MGIVKTVCTEIEDNCDSDAVCYTTKFANGWRFLNVRPVGRVGEPFYIVRFFTDHVNPDVYFSASLYTPGSDMTVEE